VTVLMDEIVVSLENVSKCFKRYAHPIDRLKEMILPGKSRAENFWALQGINLEIPKGETLGIVGQNGSGKSTLLQIIAGILTPTTGAVRVSGRVSALLELGSGFNPEFTGRQNVFFNGRILGLTQAEIEGQFDAIASFADIGDFIDQPVKTYSSGMFVRLAFAVAVHVNPEILIVDEALAVGDIFFQAKCFKQIQKMKSQGVTILFVSHDLNSVHNLCDQGILLNHGRILIKDTPSIITSEYYKLSRMQYENIVLSDQNLEEEGILLNASDSMDKFSNGNVIKSIDISNSQRLGNGKAKIQKVLLSTIENRYQDSFSVNETIKINLDIEFYDDCHNVTAGFGFRDRYGKFLFGKHSWFDQPGLIEKVSRGEILEFIFTIQLAVHPGEYLAFIGVASEQTSESDYNSLDIIQDAFVVRVTGKPQFWGIARVPGIIQVKQKILST